MTYGGLKICNKVAGCVCYVIRPNPVPINVNAHAEGWGVCLDHDGLFPLIPLREWGIRSWQLRKAVAGHRIAWSGLFEGHTYAAKAPEWANASTDEILADIAAVSAAFRSWPV